MKVHFLLSVVVLSVFTSHGFGVSKVVTIHEAAKAGNVISVKKLLEQGTDVDLRDQFGNTALHWAAGHGNVEVVKVLIARGATVDALGTSHETPLHKAASNVDTSCAQELVLAGASLKIENDQGINPFEKGLRNKEHEHRYGAIIWRLLPEIKKAQDKEATGVSSEPDKQKSSFSFGAKKREPLFSFGQGRSSSVVTAQKKPFSLSSCSLGSSRPAGGIFGAQKSTSQDSYLVKTPLYCAVKDKDYTYLKKIIQEDSEQVSKQILKVVIEFACAQGDAQALEILLTHQDASVILSREDNEALHKAAYFGHAAVVQLLIDNPAVTINKTDRFKKRSIDYAHSNGHAHVEHLLLQAGAELTTSKKKSSFSFGHRSFTQPTSNPSGPKKGFSFGGRISVPTQPEEKSEEAELYKELLVASRAGDTKKVEKLITAGVSAGVGSHNEKPLKYAAHKGHLEVVRLLLQAGADDNDKSAYKEALLWGHDAVADLIIQHRKRTEFTQQEQAFFIAAQENDVSKVNQFFDEVDDVSKGIAFCETAQKGHTQLIQFFLDKGVDYETDYHFGEGTPLILASRAGQIDVVKILLEKDPRGKDDALYAAVKSGNCLIAELLLQAGASATRTGKTKFSFGSPSFDSLLSIAARTSNKPMIDVLLKGGATDSNEAFVVAAGVGQLSVLPQLYEHCDLKEGILEGLAAASKYGYTEILSYILDRGVPVDSQTLGGTALKVAALSIQSSCVKLLLQRGAQQVQSALESAIAGSRFIFGAKKSEITDIGRRERLGCVEALLDAGGDPRGVIVERSFKPSLFGSSKSEETQTPLICAAAGKGYNLVVKKLLAAGAEVEACTSSGATPLHAAVKEPRAVSKDTREVVETLIAHGVNVLAKDNDGYTALDYVIRSFPQIKPEEGSSDILVTIMKLLFDNGASVNESNFRDCLNKFDADFVTFLFLYPSSRCALVEKENDEELIRGYSLGQLLVDVIRKNDPGLLKVVVSSWYRMVDRSDDLSNSRKTLSEVMVCIGLLKKHYPDRLANVDDLAVSEILLRNEQRKEDLITLYLTCLQQGLWYKSSLILNSAQDEVVQFLVDAIKSATATRLYEMSTDSTIDEYYGKACKEAREITQMYSVFYEQEFDQNLTQDMKKILDPYCFDDEVTSLVKQGIAECITHIKNGEPVQVDLYTKCLHKNYCTGKERTGPQPCGI